ncbi:MAG: hypothetical protein KF852_04665 [Saprospiraceae bacterium]|nr:hypothetical protein [Saprospiraceae bacterium]
MKQTNLLTVLTILCFALPAQAQIFVQHGATGNGSSWNNALGDLQEAIQLAQQRSGAQIWVAMGKYTPTRTGDRNASFNIPDGVVLIGGFAGHETSPSQRDWRNNLTVLSGEIGSPSLDDNSYSVVYTRNVSSATILDGFVITAGTANGTGIKGNPRRSGAGWYNDGSDGYSNPSIRNCLFVNNYGRDGAGMYNIAKNGVASPRLENCQFVNNHADLDGGAMFNNGSFGISSPVITNCLFEENEASYGAGMINLAEGGESRPVIAHTIFTRNLSYVRGSSVYNNREYDGICDADIDYATCVFSENNDKVGNTVSSTVNNEGAYRRGNSEIVYKTGN